MAVISRFILDLNMSLWVTLSTPAKIQVTFNAKYLLDCDQTDMTYNVENKKKRIGIVQQEEEDTPNFAENAQ